MHEEAKNELKHMMVCPPPLPFRILLLVPLEGVLCIVPLIDLSVCVMESSDDPLLHPKGQHGGISSVSSYLLRVRRLQCVSSCTVMKVLEHLRIRK